MFARSVCFLLAAILFPLSGRAEMPAAFDIEELRKAAEGGNTEAQLVLGTFYFNQASAGGESNYERACRWFRMAADAGHPEGFYNLAICLENGFGAEIDKKEALELYKNAGSKGLLPARLRELLLTLELSGDKAVQDKALQELRDLAALPYPPAANSLGDISLAAAAAADAGEAQTAERFRKEALDFFTEAADAGFAPACRNAAKLLLASARAKNTEEDAILAVKYLRTAAEQKDSEAVAQLAFCLENNIGSAGPTDMTEVRRLYEQAAAAGNPGALLRLGEIILEGDEETPADPEKAFEYFTRAAAGAHPAAALRLGMCHADGHGTEKDMTKAAEYFLMAARADIREAQFNLACLFFKGEGIPKDETAAFYWFKRAAENGDIKACRQTAYCCFNGIGTKKDNAEGIKWLSEAALLGDTEAQKLLTGE